MENGCSPSVKRGFLVPLDPATGIILDCLTDRGYVGKEELRAFVWLRVSGLPQCVWKQLHDGRYAIPLERLRFLWKLTSHDVKRLRDTNAAYQPFLGEIERPETGRIISNRLIIEPIGIIYDCIEETFI